MPMPKKTTEELKKSGSYRPSRHGKEISPASIKYIPKPPSRLNRPAKEEWKRIVKELSNQDQLSNIDKGALSLLCESYGRAVEIDETVRSTSGSWGLYLLDAKNSRLIEVYHRAIDYYSKNCGAFGITPAERLKVKPKDPKDSAFGRIMEFRPQ